MMWELQFNDISEKLPTWIFDLVDLRSPTQTETADKDPVESIAQLHSEQLTEHPFIRFQIPITAFPLSRMDIVEMEEDPKAQMLMIKQRARL